MRASPSLTALQHTSMPTRWSDPVDVPCHPSSSGSVAIFASVWLSSTVRRGHSSPDRSRQARRTNELRNGPALRRPVIGSDPKCHKRPQLRLKRALYAMRVRRCRTFGWTLRRYVAPLAGARRLLGRQCAGCAGMGLMRSASAASESSGWMGQASSAGDWRTALMRLTLPPSRVESKSISLATHQA